MEPQQAAALSISQALSIYYVQGRVFIKWKYLRINYNKRDPIRASAAKNLSYQDGQRTDTFTYKSRRDGRVRLLLLLQEKLQYQWRTVRVVSHCTSDTSTPNTNREVSQVGFTLWHQAWPGVLYLGRCYAEQVLPHMWVLPSSNREYTILLSKSKPVWTYGKGICWRLRTRLFEPIT